PLAAAAALLLAAWGSGRPVAAREQPHWRLALHLADGIYVRTGIGTVPPEAVDLEGDHPLVRGTGYLARSRAGGGSLRRILKLADGRSVVYELTIERRKGNRFRVSLAPATPSAEEAAAWGIDPARIDGSFLDGRSAPLVIAGGDVLALDTLVEPRTGTRFVDY